MVYLKSSEQIKKLHEKSSVSVTYIGDVFKNISLVSDKPQMTNNWKCWPSFNKCDFSY